MVKKILILTIVSLFWLSGYSQENSFPSKFGLGFNLTQHQEDFGLGLNAVSPYFANENVAIRLRGNLMWNQHRNVNNTATTWTPYSNVSIGIVGVAGKVGDFLRLYGEGGVIALFPSSKFSKETFLIGGYGLFGFEFFFNNHNNYFIEIGGIGTGAVADKISGEPIYSSGLIINVGYRFQF